MTKYLSILCTCVLALTLTASAQSTLKFGHINSTQLLSTMPETKMADSSLQKFGSSLEGQLKTMTAEYQSKLQKYQSSRDSMPDAIKAVKEKELEDLGNRIQDFQQTAQESIQKKKEELYGYLNHQRKLF